jgi:hypothetical protein
VSAEPDFAPRMGSVAEALRRLDPAAGWRYAGPAAGGYERFTRADGMAIDVDLHVAFKGASDESVAEYVRRKAIEWADPAGSLRPLA